MRTAVCALLVVMAACSAETAEVPAGFEDRQVVVDFADQVVVPTYRHLASRLADLHGAAESLGVDTTEENLLAAQDAWVAARQPWEQSEAILFGPVDTFGYDPALDSWPLNQTDLDAVLASEDPLTPEYVGSLQETQKGFHTVEYLLFGTGRSKTAAALTTRELEYLVAITDELNRIGAALESSWTASTGGRPAYRDVFATAGEPGNTAYPSLTAAAQELLTGMIGICDEVANGKIADPYDAHDPTLVESQFSFNSIADFQDNLRSVENAYTASVPSAATSGRGLSHHVREIDPALDTRVRQEIGSAIEAIGAIPPPFRDSITDPSAYEAIEEAQTAVRTVMVTLERDVKPLVVD